MRVSRRSVLLLALVLTVRTSLADPSELLFPPNDGFPGLSAQSAGVAFEGHLLFTVAQSSSPYKFRIFSVSMTQLRVLDEFDLESDFGSSQTAASQPRVFLKVHERTGLLLIYGQHSNGTQNVIALKSDRDGLLRKLWSITSASPGGFLVDESHLAVNADGSRVCWIYYSRDEPSRMISAEMKRQATLPADSMKATVLVRRAAKDLRFVSRDPQVGSTSNLARRLALIRVDDGLQLASADLKSESLLSSSVFFDNANNRVVALAETTAYIFASGLDALDLDSTMTPGLKFPSVFGQAMSQDGRFLLGYGGYSPDENGSGLNFYVAYDLERKTFHELDLEEQLFPFVNGMTFHQETGLLFAPLIVNLTLGASEALNNALPRDTDIIRLGLDGSLTLAARTRLPKRSADGSRPNLSVLSNVEVSATGALAFIQSDNNRLFTFDSATGEIVSDEHVGQVGRLESIRLIENMNRIVASDLSSNHLLILDASTAPNIASVKVKRRSTIVTGSNFLSGAHLLIDGIDQGVANRSVDNPGSEIILERGKKEFPTGQDFDFVAINRDGVRSRPFILRR